MAPNKPHDNEPFPLVLSYHRLIDGLSRSVLAAISGGSEERWLGPGRPCCRRTHIIGWAPSAVQATETIRESSCGPVKPSSAMQAGSVCPCRAYWSVWMG